MVMLLASEQMPSVERRQSSCEAQSAHGNSPLRQASALRQAASVLRVPVRSKVPWELLMGRSSPCGAEACGIQLLRNRETAKDIQLARRKAGICFLVVCSWFIFHSYVHESDFSLWHSAQVVHRGYEPRNKARTAEIPQCSVAGHGCAFRLHTGHGVPRLTSVRVAKCIQPASWAHFLHTMCAISG